MSRAAAVSLRGCALLLYAALGALASPAAWAAIGSCTVSATSVAFGIYTPLQAAPLASTGTISIACTGVTGRTGITIDLSTGASGNYATRTLKAGAFTLNYNLYLDAANTQIWGDGSGGSLQGTATIRRRRPNATLTAYGAVAAAQDPAAGSYTDTITVTVNY
jgi:spore coat protein U-like protein